MMRTTLTLDKDVAAALERLRRARKLSFKAAVNEALRRGLAQPGGHAPAEPRVYTRKAALGRCLIGNVDNISEVLARGEGEAYK